MMGNSGLLLEGRDLHQLKNVPLVLHQLNHKWVFLLFQRINKSKILKRNLWHFTAKVSMNKTKLNQADYRMRKLSLRDHPPLHLKNEKRKSHLEIQLVALVEQCHQQIEKNLPAARDLPNKNSKVLFRYFFFTHKTNLLFYCTIKDEIGSIF